MTRFARRFDNLSLRWKAVVIMLSVIAISLVLAVGGMLFHTRTAFERQVEQKLFLLADVIGSNSTAALAFNDVKSATETLAALASDDHIMAGGLYGAQGQLFAQYLRPGVEMSLPATPAIAASMTLREGRAEIARVIDLNGKTIGAIYLVADTAEWIETLWNFTGIAGGLFVAVLTVGFFVSVVLQRFVTEPITDLVRLMRRIAAEHDPALRAVKRGNDEIGILVDGFNGMLDEIGKRRVELEAAQHQLRLRLKDLNSEVLERKRAEEKVRVLNAELEQRVRNRTAELEAANKELEAFAYSVSHDLRAPLRAIDGFSRILLKEHSGNLNERGRDYLQRVRTGAQRMAGLIDDLLTLSRITRTQLTRQDVDITALARDVADNIAGTGDQTVRFTVVDDMHAWGDRNLLRVVFENLLGNAWKFTSKRADAAVEVGMKPDEPEPTYFVRDNGAGFDMEYSRKLFNAFQRLHDDADFPGTGIGLATVKRVINKHGGRIWAEAAVNNGATFFFTLPGPEARGDVQSISKRSH